MNNSKKSSCPKCNENNRLGIVGGQAVLEGVMMKAGDKIVTTCRRENGELTVTADNFVSVRRKNKILDLPIIRGVVNFVEMMSLSLKTMSVSAEALGIEEEETKFERWLKKHFGVSILPFIMGVSIVLGVALALFLFMFLPIALTSLINYLTGGALGVWTAVIEGVAKIGIFLAYLSLVSLMKDIKRTFMYHGAEHKSIACFEAGEELTPENAARYTRFHPRCGTSFMFLMILLGIFAGFFIKIILPGLHTAAYFGIRLLILPLLMGIGYEFIRFAGRHDNVITRAVSAPGLWVQRITTKEPTEDMLEVAIISLKCALCDDYPEFMEFYKAAPWEKKTESDSASDTECTDESTEPQPSDSTEDVSESADGVGEDKSE